MMQNKFISKIKALELLAIFNPTCPLLDRVL
jgi:hypothetical protein